MFFRKHHSLSKRESGQTIIEVLVALGASVAVIAAVTVSVISGLNNALYYQNQNSATQYAQQGMELIRSMRDKNFSSLSALNGQYCLDSSDTGLSSSNQKSTIHTSGCVKEVNDLSPTPDNLPPFAREVDINNTSGSKCANTQLEVTVIVSWTDGKCVGATDVYCHNVKLDSCFSNVVNTVPTP